MDIFGLSVRRKVVLRLSRVLRRKVLSFNYECSTIIYDRA